MARLATGLSVIEAARKQLSEAKTLEELRSAQALIFPLDLGLSMAQTVQAIGLSKGWACHLRRAFIARQVLPEQDRVLPAKAGSGKGRAYLRHQQDARVSFAIRGKSKPCRHLDSERNSTSIE